jgi:internalin A
MRILSFPSGESAGSLRRREPDTRIRHHIHRIWARVGEAVDDVQIEDDAEILFIPCVDDLSFLLRLQATDLRAVYFYFTTINDDSLRTLQHFPFLYELSADNPHITDAGIAALGEMQAMEMLDLSFSALTDRGLAALERMGKLIQLGLGATSVTGAGLLSLNAANLESISLAGTPFDGRFMSRFNGMPKLRYLGLAGTTISDDDITQLGHFEELEIDLAGTHIGDRAIDHLCASGACYLNLAGTRITSRSLQRIGSDRRLRHLNVAKTAIDDDGMRHLSTLQDLRLLFLDGTGITDTGLSYLRHLPRLDCLSIRSTAITSRAVEYLSSMPSLISLIVDAGRLGADAEARLRTALPDCVVHHL